MKRFGLVLVGILVAIALTELVLRFLNIQAIQPHYTEAFVFPCYTKGTSYWIALKPSTDCRMISNAHAFDPVDIITNELGLRNENIRIPKPKEVARILVLGDSFTMGMGVAEQKTYPRITEAMLAKQFPKKQIEVINAGLPTADLSYSYLFLKNLMQTLSPDIIVIGFYPFNDVHDEEMLPYYLSTDAEELPTVVDSQNAYVDYSGVIYSKKLPSLMKVPYIRSLHVTGLIGYIITHIPGRKTVSKLHLVSPQVCLFISSCHTFDEDTSRAKKLFQAMKNITNDKKLLVVLIPAELQIYDTARYKFNIPTPLSPTQKHYLHNQWTEFFATEQISSLDLLPVFLANPTPKTYFDNDTHWNETGHAIAAEVITKELLPYFAQ